MCMPKKDCAWDCLGTKHRIQPKKSKVTGTRKWWIFRYTHWLFHIAMENCPFIYRRWFMNVYDGFWWFPHLKLVIFYSYGSHVNSACYHQRVPSCSNPVAIPLAAADPLLASLACALRRRVSSLRRCAASSCGGGPCETRGLHVSPQSVEVCCISQKWPKFVFAWCHVGLIYNYHSSSRFWAPLSHIIWTYSKVIWLWMLSQWHQQCYTWMRSAPLLYGVLLLSSAFLLQTPSTPAGW